MSIESFVFPIAAMSQYLFGITLFILSVFLILLILLQQGRGGGLTGALGGPGGQSAFGTKAGDIFTRITIITATIWIFLAAFCVYFYNEPGAASALSGTADDVGTLSVETNLVAPGNDMGLAPGSGSLSIPPVAPGAVGETVTPVVPPAQGTDAEVTEIPAETSAVTDTANSEQPATSTDTTPAPDASSTNETVNESEATSKEAPANTESAATEPAAADASETPAAE